MKRRRAKLTLGVAGLAALYAGSAAFLWHALPEPRQQFEYMVIGCGATGVAMFAFYAGCLLRSRF